VRRRLFYALHRKLADDQPYTWLFQANLKHAFSRRVRNVEMSDGYGPFLWYPGELAWTVER
jgi:hypothetical protein